MLREQTAIQFAVYRGRAVREHDTLSTDSVVNICRACRFPIQSRRLVPLPVYLTLGPHIPLALQTNFLRNSDGEEALSDSHPAGRLYQDDRTHPRGILALLEDRRASLQRGTEIFWGHTKSLAEAKKKRNAAIEAVDRRGWKAYDFDVVELVKTFEQPGRTMSNGN